MGCHSLFLCEIPILPDLESSVWQAEICNFGYLIKCVINHFTFSLKINLFATNQTHFVITCRFFNYHYSGIYGKEKLAPIERSHAK